MKKQSLIIWSYALLLLIGGLIGFFKANSYVSLFTSSFFAILLFGCGYLVRKGNLAAYIVASSLTICLLAFFAYRFILTHQFMPSGLMTILSAIMAAYLGMKWKNFWSHHVK